jgi:hypothetical protein
LGITPQSHENMAASTESAADRDRKSYTAGQSTHVVNAA